MSASRHRHGSGGGDGWQLYAELLQRLPAEALLNIDETGHAEGTRGCGVRRLSGGC